MNINQKSIAVLSSPYLFAISQVGAALAALAPKNHLPQVRMWAADQGHGVPASDGQRSMMQEGKISRYFTKNYCGEVIPAKRVNRKDRRADAKFARRNPTIKVS